MKIFYKFFILGILFLVMQNSLIAQIYIPDENFRAVLGSNYGITFDANGNTKNTEKIESIDYLIIDHSGIRDLKGIEAFSSLENLRCEYNLLTKIDLTSNKNLRGLNCSLNFIDTLIFSSNNQKMESITCDENKIVSLDLSLLTSLNDLRCDKNLINSLLLPKTNTLKVIKCDSNQLQELNVNGCTGTIWLECDNYKINKLEISQLYSLVYLSCSENNLSTLNLNANTELYKLDCSKNQIASLSLNNNKKLETINCSNNQINNLVISSKNYLGELNCSHNSISELNLENNINLSVLDCSFNLFTNLKLENNSSLYRLNCGNNNLSKLNISKNLNLYEVRCNNNQMAKLNISNKGNYPISTLDIRGNKTPFKLYVSILPFSKNEIRYFYDTNPISEKIHFDSVFPDSNFRASLRLNYSLEFKDDYSVSNPDIVDEITELKVSGKNINSLIGIEIFSQLAQLDCSTNNLSKLDVSANNKLHTLNCSDNKLTNVDISYTPDLSELNINGNPTPFTVLLENSSFPPSNLINFTDTSPPSNKMQRNSSYPIIISDINFKLVLKRYGVEFNANNSVSNPQFAAELKKLDLSFADIYEIKGIELFGELSELFCNSNKIKEINLSNNKLLKLLDCSSNQLNAISISNNAILETLNCSSNNISNLDVSNNKKLKKLVCSYNNIKVLGLSENNELSYLACNSNSLNDLNLVSNLYIESLYCLDNNLSVLNLSKNTMLKYLNCSKNNLSELDLSFNNKLYEISCNNNKLTYLNISGMDFLRTLNCSSNLITKLDAFNNSNLRYLSIWGNKTPFTLGVWTLPFPPPEGPDYVYIFFDTYPASIKVLGSVSVNNNSSNPETFSLSQNYPNPFNPTTKINYQIKSDSQVSLKIYDLLGREMKTMVNQFKPAGEYQVDFDGSEFPSGVYIYKLQAGSFIEMKKMMLVK